MAERLFATEKVKGRLAYRLYACSVLVGICLVLYYRATHVPAALGEGKVAWVGLFLAELWYSFYWISTQSVRWSPIRRRTFKDRLSLKFLDILSRKSEQREETNESKVYKARA